MIKKIELIVGDCLDVMDLMYADSIDLTVTSPPYDDLRTYKGFSFDFEPIARELYRVTKPGGVVVWVVGDATVKGSETGTSFKQALYFKECGFNLHDTMIWNKTFSLRPKRNGYGEAFEFMFVLTKRQISKTNILKDRLNRSYGRTKSGGLRQKDGTVKQFENQGKPINEFSARTNVWDCFPAMSSKERTGHPAQFPEALARDHILSWSNENDLVFDPFLGSGTTAKMALKNNRRFIGCDVSAEYVELTKGRLLAHNLPIG